MSVTRLTKVWGTVAATALIAATGVLLVSTTQIGDEKTPQRTPVAVPEGDTRSLKEIAADASGKPGEIVPPCPKPEIVQRIKEASIPLGPCDPVPEPGETLTVPESPLPPEVHGVVCPDIQADRGVADFDVKLPCGKGAKILDTDFIERDGRSCMRVTFRASENAATDERVVCGRPFGETPSNSQEHSHD